MTTITRMMKSAIGYLTIVTLVGCGEGQQPRDPAFVAEGAPTPVSGVVIGRGPACADCTARFDELVVLGTPLDELPIGEGSFVVPLPSGSCIVGPTDRSGELLAFDGCRAPAREFGVIGEGPGELSFIRAIVPWRGDSVLAFGYGQMTILSGASGNGRSVRFDPGTEGYDVTAVGSDSSVVVKNNNPAKGQFSAIQSDGSVGPTFGLPAPLGREIDPRRYRVELGPSTVPGSFWAGGTFYQVELTRWSTGGERLNTFMPDVDWYTPYDSTALDNFYAVGAEAARPLPFLRAVHETADGILWVAFSVPASDWQPDSIKTEELRSPSGEVVRRGGSRFEHYDGMLLALKAATGEHLLTIRTADVVGGFANDTLAFARRTGPDEVPQLALFSFGLQRGP